MANETSATRKTLERNLRRGRWVLVGDYDATRTRYLVTVPKAKKTLAAGRTMYVDIHYSKAENEARLAREQAEQLAKLRAIREARDAKNGTLYSTREGRSGRFYVIKGENDVIADCFYDGEMASKIAQALNAKEQS